MFQVDRLGGFKVVDDLVSAYAFFRVVVATQVCR